MNQETGANLNSHPNWKQNLDSNPGWVAFENPKTAQWVNQNLLNEVIRKDKNED